LVTVLILEGEVGFLRGIVSRTGFCYNDYSTQQAMKRITEYNYMGWMVAMKRAFSLSPVLSIRLADSTAYPPEEWLCTADTQAQA